MHRILMVAALFSLTSVACAADDSGAVPRPIPLTRLEVKQFLEDMKTRKPRIPLPALTEEEQTKLGERGVSYESRLRLNYMPPGETRGGGFSREPDPNMSLAYAFKTQLFWIVSRTTNCHY
jgi:hypothetical protein